MVAPMRISVAQLVLGGLLLSSCECLAFDLSYHYLVTASDLIVVGKLEGVSTWKANGNIVGSGDLRVAEVIWNGRAVATDRLSLRWVDTLQHARVDHAASVGDEQIWFLSCLDEAHAPEDLPRLDRGSGLDSPLDATVTRVHAHHQECRRPFTERTEVLRAVSRSYFFPRPRRISQFEPGTTVNQPVYFISRNGSRSPIEMPTVRQTAAGTFIPPSVSFKLPLLDTCEGPVQLRLVLDSATTVLVPPGREHRVAVNVAVLRDLAPGRRYGLELSSSFEGAYGLPSVRTQDPTKSGLNAAPESLRNEPGWLRR